MKSKNDQGSPATRRKHTNSKLGCLNCKKKKIRCDESLPECNNCAKGKKNKCSYLSLSAKEVNKILLTHSLRSSQNKLLSSDYRLPTSNRGDLQGYQELEFKHELDDLPIRIPSFTYPPLQYKTVSYKDIESDFKDEEPGSGSDQNYGSAEPVPQPVDGAKGLPNAITGITRFQRVPHKIHIVPQIKINEYQFTKVTLVDYLLPKFFEQPPKYISILNDMTICLGQSVALFELKKLRPLGDPCIGILTKKCFENHSRCLTELRIKLTEFNRTSTLPPSAERDEYMNEMTPILYYSNCFISYCIILLDFSMENYHKINSTGISIIKNFLVYNNGRPINNLIQTIMTTYQFQILLVKLPAYDTSFLGELISNLESLAVVFGTLPETVPNLRVLRTQYYTLMDFIKLDLLPMLNHKKIDNKVINYPVDCIYNLLKKWYTIFPSASFLPVTPHNDLVTSDLRSTIFSYYYVVGAALRVCFPQTPYLFGVSFATLQTYAARRFFEISPSVNSLNIGTNLQDSLQRHNYYALRLYSFLRHRVRIFIKGIEWESEFPEDRSANRAFKNVMEVPIKSFADTLVRPEHYATIRYEDREPGHRFVRTDETMISQLYARNIETLKFFDGNCVLQFDYQSMALLRDYRPIPSTGIVNFPDITVTDLDYYMEDRRHIIRNFKQNV